MAKKIVNSDIYNMRRLVDDIKRLTIPEESESTLAIGQIGYFGDIEAKRLQTQVIISSELSNESFPSRARLERNVITHAIVNNISNINAGSSKLDAIIGIRQTDIDAVMTDDTFVIDRECSIYIEEYEYHLEYDIIVKRVSIAGNEKVYTAQYDIKRKNPSSNIVNPYISSPAVVMLDDNSTYIFINVILSQVHHDVKYKKPTTSNVIDNKTLNFNFEDQLVYFEVHVLESDSDHYLTPIFEGAGVPEGISLYCWYQYIDVDMIRVRFDRNSYMPGLNSEIEILYKTTRGKLGNNDRYKDDIFINLESKKYGYSNLSALFKVVSDSEGGKDRKTKKELQSIIPKESLSRGSLTTIKDLNNYFSMIDSEQGRIVVQKKIDNQQERIYYAYFVLKDMNGDIVPSNTIDLKIPMNQLIETNISDSSSPRYVLRSGACIHLMNDNQTGEIINTPIKNLGLEWNTPTINAGDIVDMDFSIKIDNDEYPSINCRALIGTISSVYIESPQYTGSIYTPNDESQPVDVIDDMNVSAGQSLRFKTEYTCLEENTDIIFEDILHESFDYIRDTSVYYADDDRTPFKLDPVIDGNQYTFIIPNAIKGKKYFVQYDVKTNEKMERMVERSVHIKNGPNESDSRTIRLYGLILTVKENPDKILIGNKIDYHISFIAKEDMNYTSINVELSRGISYMANSTKLTIKDKNGTLNNYIFNPSTKDLLLDAGFLYTNPYSIVINHYMLYSTFYMMCVNISPFVHFEYINQRSSVQFIATNLNWQRPFLGYNKNLYTMDMEISQSVARDMGLIVKDDDTEEIINVKVKMIALFYRDGVPYRYKNMNLDYVDESTYSFVFKSEFEALDLLDQDNNIKVNNMGLLNQVEEEYGFFNANTEVKIYTLCQFPDVDGRYTRHNIDTYVPGLDGWTVTNVYNIVNGIDFYYNYAEIMGSRVIPYGNPVIDEETGIETMELGGYYVKGVPVFGYDYCKNEYMINNAVDALNDRKLYIDDAAEKCENSFGIDFKLFNTYGPSKVFYILTDMVNGQGLIGSKKFIDRVNATMNFRLKLRTSNDSYTKNLIIKEVKDYMEDLNEMGEIHIPKLVTQINTNYTESIVYFEFLGFNDYGPGIQHLYKLPDREIPIHVCPEFININNIQLNTGNQPDINIYLSDD